MTFHTVPEGDSSPFSSETSRILDFGLLDELGPACPRRICLRLSSSVSISYNNNFLQSSLDKTQEAMCFSSASGSQPVTSDTFVRFEDLFVSCSLCGFYLG